MHIAAPPGQDSIMVMVQEPGPVGTLHLVISLLAANNQSQSQSARWTIWHTEHEWWAEYRALLMRVLLDVLEQFKSRVPDMHLFTEKAFQIHIVGIMEAGEFQTE